MLTTPVNLKKLNSVFDAQVLQGIKYRLGGKAPSLNVAPVLLEKGIDCSGEVRLLLYQATNGALVLPDGSWNQRSWCEKNLEEVSYADALKGNEGEIFIAFITPGQRGAGKVGHVWLVEGQPQGKTNTTMESYGGHGIGSRPADTGVLVRQVHKCFRVPTVSDEKPAPAPVQPKPTMAPVASTLYLNDEKIEGATKVNGAWMVPLRAVATAAKMQLFQQQSGPGERWTFYKPPD